MSERVEAVAVVSVEGAHSYKRRLILSATIAKTKNLKAGTVARMPPKCSETEKRRGEETEAKPVKGPGSAHLRREGGLDATGSVDTTGRRVSSCWGCFTTGF